jgi:hypothetical protein
MAAPQTTAAPFLMMMMMMNLKSITRNECTL